MCFAAGENGGNEEAAWRAETDLLEIYDGANGSFRSMADIEIALLEEYRRPAICCETALGELDVLLDTGAYMPVWNNEAEQLQLNFPDAQETQYVTSVSGFGGNSATIYQIWKIPQIDLKDSRDVDKKLSTRKRVR